MEVSLADTFEVSMPRTKSTTQFLALHTKEKLKVVELGMTFLATGNRQVQYWNNDQWEGKLTALKLEKQKRIEKLLTEMRDLKEELERLKVNHQGDMNNLVSKARGQAKLLYKGELESLRETIRTKDAAIASKALEASTSYQKAYADFSEKLDSREEHWEAKLVSQRDRYETKLQEATDALNRLTMRAQNSTLKGQSGENLTLHVLTRMFPTAEVEDTHSQKGRGDFIMREIDFCMLIETKNYRNNVTKPEIDKFYRDMEVNNDIDCGLFMSLKSGICARADFALEVCSGKPIIFLHNVTDNMENVRLAVQLFRLIKQSDMVDLTSTEITCKLKNSIPVIKRNWSKIRQRLQKLQVAVGECIDDQEGVVKTIFELANLRY